jgi:hypothetical protein
MSYNADDRDTGGASPCRGRTRAQLDRERPHAVSVVADPEGSEWNQAGVGWDSGKGTVLIAGRQRINLDNQRFIGAVGWRQNEQTFDAFTATHTFSPKTTLRYAYLAEVHRVFGHAHPNPLSAGFDLDGHLLNASHVFSAGTLTGYGYFIENEDLSPTSARTLGVRFAGARPLSEPWKLVYAAEFAQQADWRDGARTIDADYSLLEFGAAHGAYTGKLAREVLGGNGVYAFQTPFATLHAFNGWADKFLTTPVNGLVDTYLQFNGPIGKLQWVASYHAYDADHGGASYGSEWDASLLYTFRQRFTAIAKFASYDATPSPAIPTRSGCRWNTSTEKSIAPAGAPTFLRHGSQISSTSLRPCPVGAPEGAMLLAPTSLRPCPVGAPAGAMLLAPTSPSTSLRPCPVGAPEGAMLLAPTSPSTSLRPCPVGAPAGAMLSAPTPRHIRMLLITTER